MMSTASTIKRIRLCLCYEQKEFGKLIGVSKQSVSHYENGVTTPRLPVVRKLMDLAKKHKLNVKVQDFLPESEQDIWD